MEQRQPEVSTDFAWSTSEMAAYHEQYQQVAHADSMLAGVAIRAIAHQDAVGQFDSALIIGAGGVPRGAGIVSPALSETAALVMSDSTQQNVALTRHIVEQIKQGDLRQSHWIRHEEDMAQHDHRWTRAIGRAATIATFEILDLRRINKRIAQVVGMEYVAESMLSSKSEYEIAMRNFTDSAEEMVYMAYTVNSGGYMVGNKHHPAYRVGVDQAAEQIERGGFELLHDPHKGFTPKSDELRQGDDHHDFDGFGAIVAIRK